MHTRKSNKEQQQKEEKTIYGAITVFYKKTKKGLLFLIAENTKTGNISFISGAQEDGDQSPEATARRENVEELGLRPDQYELKMIGVRHEFIFDPSKKERTGQKSSYQVFVSDLTNADFEVSPTAELKSLKWMTEKDVLHSLTFSDVAEVFKKTVKTIKP